ncbi:MAG: TIGR02147 family protein [Bdellovibrionales bacterium]|nr:TIGR02147 family protein [Bdellovibrionales bacterium]
MKANIFDYREIIQFIRDWIEANGHGAKSIIAQTSGVQLAYFSLVLKGRAQLSLEQAIRLKDLFEFTPEEAEFFLLLAHLNRAGSKDLAQIYEAQIQNILRKRTLLKERIGNVVSFSIEEQTQYFSCWLYPAIHTAILNPNLRTQKQLENHFHLTSLEVGEALDFLEGINLIKKEKSSYFVESFRMHLPSDSPLITQYHTQWRLLAIRDLNKMKQDRVHYSSVFSLSKKDAAALQKEILDLIEGFEKKLKISEDEVLYSMGVDWFEL